MLQRAISPKDMPTELCKLIMKRKSEVIDDSNPLTCYNRGLGRVFFLLWSLTGLGLARRHKPS
jgi:hypothetical protein